MAVEHGTHLTINGARTTQADKVKYHSQETSHAGDGVNLVNEQISLRHRCDQGNQSEAPNITHPYRPQVGTLAPNDHPFIVKRGEEFPAGQKKVGRRNTPKKGNDSQIDTSHDVPDPHKSYCQENRVIGRARIAAKRYVQATCGVKTRS
jgi:hypothetical protein